MGVLIGFSWCSWVGTIFPSKYNPFGGPESKNKKNLLAHFQEINFFPFRTQTGLLTYKLQRGVWLREAIARKPFELQSSGWSQWLRQKKYFVYRLSPKVRKCHFNLRSALIKAKGHFWLFFEGVSTLKAHISETVWATDLGLIPLDSAWIILVL